MNCKLYIYFPGCISFRGNDRLQGFCEIDQIIEYDCNTCIVRQTSEMLCNLLSKVSIENFRIIFVHAKLTKILHAVLNKTSCTQDHKQIQNVFVCSCNHSGRLQK